MNLKAIIAAAVVIVIAGVGTGVAIGGKTETKTVTTTVAKVKTTTVTAAPTTTTTSDPTGTENVLPGVQNAPEEPIPSDTQLFTVPPRFSDSTETPTANETAQLRLGPPAPGFDVGLNTEYPSTPLRYGFEITNPDTESARSFVTRIGFSKNTNSGYSAKVYFRYDSYSNDPVKTLMIRSSGRQSVQPVNIPVQGKSNLSVEIITEDREWPSDGLTVTMLDPGFNPTQ